MGNSPVIALLSYPKGKEGKIFSCYIDQLLHYLCNTQGSSMTNDRKINTVLYNCFFVERGSLICFSKTVWKLC